MIGIGLIFLKSVALSVRNNRLQISVLSLILIIHNRAENDKLNALYIRKGKQQKIIAQYIVHQIPHLRVQQRTICSIDNI